MFCEAPDTFTNELPPATIEGAGFSSSEGPGWHMQLGAGPDDPFVSATQDEAIIVSGLPDTVVMVEIVVGAETMQQKPKVGTAAFPITESGVDVRIKAYDVDDKIVWDSSTFDLPTGDAGN